MTLNLTTLFDFILFLLAIVSSLSQTQYTAPDPKHDGCYLCHLCAKAAGLANYKQPTGKRPAAPKKKASERRTVRTLAWLYNPGLNTAESLTSNIYGYAASRYLCPFLTRSVDRPLRGEETHLNVDRSLYPDNRQQCRRCRESWRRPGTRQLGQGALGPNQPVHLSTSFYPEPQ